MKDDQERTPLRTILQNFINHIENLETRRIEDSYEKEFQELKFFSEILKTSKHHCCSEGEKEVNRKKNRYKDISPFDSSRVILDEYAGVPGSDYINANFIKGASGSPAYIASQGPLPHTVNDFWRMVVECEVQVIVMACNQEEAGKHKCENYWVEREGEERQFGMVTIRLLKASIVCPDFLVRTMLLKYTNNQSSTVEERTVCQFHYSAWPDHGVPPLVRPLLDMVRLVRDTQASETLPVLVHCSAGCGRTGTICAIDYVFGLLRAGKLTKNFSLYHLVRDMRKQRIAMVQTKEQYVLVHQAVRELFCEQLRMIDAHPYENIDANGMPLEPTYATRSEENAEKQDSKEKETEAPPLPHKRKVHVASSKQEKEVENLSEKQRCIVEQSSGSESGSGSISSGMSSLLSRPRISKLKALFERNSTPRESRNSSNSRRRNSQQVARSHSLGPIRKLDEDGSTVWQQPIPGRGILRVPQLITPITPAIQPPKPALPVKRSKSLKVLSSGERQKFSVLVPQSAAVNQMQQPQTHTPREGCDVLVKNKSVAVIKNPASSAIPPKEIVLKSRDAEPSDYLVARTSRNGMLPPGKSQPSLTFDLTPRHRQVDYMTWRNYEQPLRRRHSLESVILDDVVLQAGSSQARSEFQTGSHHLDHDARKLLQDCRDYLMVESRTPPSNGVLTINEQFQHLSLDSQKKINAIVAGLGVRERRNSFRQAVGTSRDPGGQVRDYESIWPGGNQDVSRLARHVPLQSSATPSDKRSNGFTNPAQRIHVDDGSHNYQRLTESSKYGSKSLTPKSGGSLRIKGTQVFSFSKGNEFEDVDGSKATEFNGKDLQTQPWSRKDQPIVNHAATYTGIRMTPKRSNMAPNQSKTMTYQESRRPLTTPADKRIYVKRMSQDDRQSASKEHKYNGIPSVAESVNKVKSNAIGSGPVRRIDPPAATSSGNAAFEDTRGHIWPSPSGSETKSKQTTESQKPSLRSNPNVWLTPVPLAAGGVSVNANCKPRCDLRLIKPEKGAKSDPSQQSGPSHISRPSTEAARNSYGRLDTASDMARSQANYTSLSPRINSTPSSHDSDAVSYGLVAGVQVQSGSRDDLELGPTAPPRVRRHASVVLLRRSLDMNTPLTVWNSSREETGRDWAAGASGVDLDTVAASIKPRRPVGDQSATLTRALEALHLRKALQRVEIEQQHIKQQPQGFSQLSTPVKKQQYL